MSTRDPRPSDGLWPERSEQREPTQSLQLDSDDLDLGDSDPSQSLARGTHEARDSSTKIESPAAQRKTPPPAAPRAGSARDEVPRKSSKRRQSGSRPRSDDPKDYLGTMLG